MPEAIQHHREIRDRIGWFGGEQSAESFTQHLMEVVEQAELFPSLGRTVPEFGLSQIRERMVGDYRLIYEMVPDGIEVIAVIHASRDLSS